MNVYSAEERASAVPQNGPRNWNNGDPMISPAYALPGPLPDGVREDRGGALSGVDAICGRMEEGR